MKTIIWTLGIVVGLLAGAGVGLQAPPHFGVSWRNAL